MRFSWVLVKILFDTGSLAGDFISHDLLTLTRLKGQHFVYKTAIYLTIWTIIFIITPFLPYAHTIPSLSYGLSCFPRKLLRLPACLFLFLFIFLFLFSTVLQLFLSSSKSALRFAAMRTLSEVAVRQPVRWASSTPHALLSPVSIWYRHLYIYWYLLFVHQHSLFYLSLLALLCTFLVYPIASHPFIHQSKVGQVESFWSHLRSADRHFLPYRRCNLSPSTSTSLYLNPCHPPYFSSYSYSCLLLSFFFSTVLTIILDHHVSLLLSLFPFLHYLRYCICIVQSHPVCPSAMMTWKDLSLTRTDPSPHSPSQPFSK